MLKKSALSYPFFQMFPSHGIPEVMEDFKVHFIVDIIPIWNKFKVKETDHQRKPRE
jgi:hypothetical protein